MSYAGPTRARGSRRTASAAASTPVQSRRGGRPTSSTSSFSAADGETDWERVALFGVGVTLGLAVGAGAALLTAPVSGAETRAALKRRARRLQRNTVRRGHDAWEELREELRNARVAFHRRKVRRAQRKELEREMD